MTIAIWCILIAATLPYVAFAFVKGLDPNLPRDHVGDLTGRAARAYGAHLNAIETFPWFAAAVIVAQMIGGPSRIADVLAVAYVLLRTRAHGGLHRRPSAAAVGGLRPRATRGGGDFRLAALPLKQWPLSRGRGEGPRSAWAIGNRPDGGARLTVQRRAQIWQPISPATEEASRRSARAGPDRECPEARPSACRERRRYRPLPDR